MLITILVVVLILSVVGGGLGHRRVGFVGWSPAAVILVVLGVLFLTGRLGA